MSEEKKRGVEENGACSSKDSHVEVKGEDVEIRLQGMASMINEESTKEGKGSSSVRELSKFDMKSSGEEEKEKGGVKWDGESEAGESLFELDGCLDEECVLSFDSLQEQTNLYRNRRIKGHGLQSLFQNVTRLPVIPEETIDANGDLVVGPTALSYPISSRSAYEFEQLQRYAAAQWQVLRLHHGYNELYQLLLGSPQDSAANNTATNSGNKGSSRKGQQQKKH